MVNDSLSPPSMASNQTLFDTALPPLPEYTLSPQPDMVWWFPDFWLNVIGPVIVYWIVSMFFHLIDVFDIFPQYRLHTRGDYQAQPRLSIRGRPRCHYPADHSGVHWRRARPDRAARDDRP